MQLLPRFPKNRPALLLAAALAFAAALPPAARAMAGEAPSSAAYTLAPAGDELFPENLTPGAPPPDGKCLVVFQSSQIKAADVNHVTVTGPDGRQMPLQVLPLFTEFSNIVEARMAFLIDEAGATDGSGPFTLRWGPEVSAQNTKVEAVAMDPAAGSRARYRTLKARQDGNSTQLLVIADRSAEYHFLWYLLPMALVFGLLIFRKMSSSGDADSATP